MTRSEQLTGCCRHCSHWRWHRRCCAGWHPARETPTPRSCCWRRVPTTALCPTDAGRPSCWTRDASRAPTAGTIRAGPSDPRTRRRRTTGRASSAAARLTTAVWRWPATAATTTTGRSSAIPAGTGTASPPPSSARDTALRRPPGTPGGRVAVSRRVRRRRRSRRDLPQVDHLDNPDGVSEVGLSPVNIRDGVRWNTALAYLDPVRDRPNLRIVGNVLVDRIELAGGRPSPCTSPVPDGPARIAAQRVVVSAGAYGSPALLLRSGIGPPDQLAALGHHASTRPGWGRPGRCRTIRRSASRCAPDRTCWRAGCTVECRRPGCPTSRPWARRAAASAARHSTCTSSATLRRLPRRAPRLATFSCGRRVSTCARPAASR